MGILRVGLTGGIGSGKSTIASLFAKYGIPVIEADDLAKEVVAPGLPAYQEIITTFGTDIVRNDQSLDRALLRNKIFNDSTLRKRLETILHPRIREEIRLRSRDLHAPYCLIVIPLLIEAAQQDLVDRILLVDTHKHNQIQRVQARSGLMPKEIEKIMAAQADNSERRRYATEYIENNSDMAYLSQQVTQLHQHYLTLVQAKK